MASELPVASDIAEWQIYRNAKYGYEIRYPEGFEAWPTGPADDLPLAPRSGTGSLLDRIKGWRKTLRLAPELFPPPALTGDQISARFRVPNQSGEFQAIEV